MKKYEIFNREDYYAFRLKITNFICDNEKKGLPFKKLSITVKSWRKERTSQQLKFYWVVMNGLSSAFKNVGYDYSKDECHELKKHMGTQKYLQIRVAKKPL